MSTSNASPAFSIQNASRPVTQFQRPDNCPVAMCSAMAMYEQELERHRETESRLREMVLRESDRLRRKNDLILQKDIMAKESEHRFLNGLQLISSVLAMESRGAKSTEAATLLRMAANRVATLAHVHQHLHTLDKLEAIGFKTFLEKLCLNLTEMASSESAERTLCVEGAELKIPRDIATPLGYIASELITNSIKYAKGRISVSLQTSPNGKAVLSVSDDGAGLPETFDPAATSGLGMKIIAGLVKHIHGELDFARGAHGQGTRISVLFNPTVVRQ